MECIFEGGPTFKPKEHTVIEVEQPLSGNYTVVEYGDVTLD